MRPVIAFASLMSLNLYVYIYIYRGILKLQLLTIPGLLWLGRLLGVALGASAKANDMATKLVRFEPSSWRPAT